MKVVLTGGGTGGHIYPALSVARLLLSGDQPHEVLYVGSAEGPEATIVPAAGVPFRSVPSRKLSRKPTPASLAALAVSAGGVLKAAGLLRSWKPDVVLGTGGYASAGIMFAAGLLRIPTVVHEANVVPGRVNRLLARLCSRIALTYEESRRYFPAEKCVVTGLPVRADLLNGDPARARATWGLSPDRPLLVVSGGSGGAQTLNEAVLEVLPWLEERKIEVVHPTGRSQFDRVEKRRRELYGDRSFPLYHPTPYVDDMPALLSAATLILCRGGSSTLAEVTALGLPALIVPYPFAVADHQSHNAKALAAAGAALHLPDAGFGGEVLRREVCALLDDPALLEAMRQASRGQSHPHAAEEVVRLLLEVARGK